MDKDKELELVKEKIGVSDLSQVSDEDFKRIQELAARNELSRHQMTLLVEAMPQFVELQKTYIEGLKELIASAKETQRDALHGISQGLDRLTEVLKEIVSRSESDELRGKVADIALRLSEYHLEIAKILKETNQDNNSFWKGVGVAAGVAVAAVGLGFAAILGKRK